MPFFELPPSLHCSIGHDLHQGGCGSLLQSHEFGLLGGGEASDDDDETDDETDDEMDDADDEMDDADEQEKESVLRAKRMKVE